GAAVGVSGQAFTILPKQTACYHCMFPSLDEESMPTCSIEGVHPPILSL
ncbi:MAG: 4-methyl-5(B-hydroxyethyl)-thiazole monophosphate biosynthesis protein, partial [Nitrosopumilaceae archaeon]|nr:4-methyl-5(B-hydroxyethyl)-thiazole monophosphate biosynthesis protein [Nitrosopumilaceae archaeon]